MSTVNSISLKGKIVAIQKEIAQPIYFITMAVTRLSGIIDLIDVHAQLLLVESMKLKVGAFIEVNGQMRTVDLKKKETDDHNRVAVYAYATQIQSITEQESLIDNNIFVATGCICKKKPLRPAGQGRVIVDAILQIRRDNPYKCRYEYIPIVCWNYVAKYIETQSKGITVDIVGRFQSREYFSIKRQKTETAYEISVSSLLPHQTKLMTFIKQKEEEMNYADY